MPKPSSSLYRKKSNIPIALALTAFTAMTFSFPIFLSHSPEHSMSTKESGLSSAAIRRGVFMNSGSKDVGYDVKNDVDLRNYASKKNKEE
jgi:hypothetical protein